jgi:hypothetical protein
MRPDAELARTAAGLQTPAVQLATGSTPDPLAEFRGPEAVLPQDG